MLAVYEGFCNLKQINLKVKICKASSVRRALVREASLFGASKVVLGIAKKRRGLSSLHSVAKYCSKKLPAKCAVLAVDNGKIIFRRESNAHSGKVSAELPGCGDDGMYCEVPFQTRQCKEDPLPLDEPKDGGGGGGGEDEQHDAGTKGSDSVYIASGEQPSSTDTAELSRDQIAGDVHPSGKGEESAMDQKDEMVSDLPGEGASVLYCVLPARNGNSAASTSSRQSDDLTEPPAEGDGELYCLLPPRNGNSGRTTNDSSRSAVSQKHDDPADPSPEGDSELYCQLPRNGNSGRTTNDSSRSAASQKHDDPADPLPEGDSELYCQLPRTGHSGRSFGGSKRSVGAKEAEDSLQDSTQNIDTPSSSPLSLRRMVEGRHDRCRLRRRIFNHQRSSSFEWARISMVQWAMRLPSRYASVHPDIKSLKSDASPSLNCDSECESTSAVSTESMFSFSLYDISWPPSELESLQEKYSSICRLFSYEELKLATSNFSEDMLIGKGGTSQVYKAQLFDGTFSAVKILKPSVDALQEFITEVEIATTLQHDNIVSLRGFSSDNYSLVLVYDYVLQGSLDRALHGKHDNKDILSWEKRNKIAIGIAKALEYLHHERVNHCVIHGDVKSSNILLSEDFQAQLCDFGLAKQVSASTPQLTCTDITGTFGYLAPEYFSHGKVNKKIDVYAFGVVTLEIISGRRPIRTGCAKGQESLVGWAKPLLSSGEIKQLVDPILGNDYDCDEMERMTLAASLCTRISSHSRPKMSQVKI
ncbi:hypothetical protein GUJ93_ZPchr0003g18051 [Zizania palustris]|uniref:Protein kinase domain-containing protein n=1 Tax=Zizania palustris TaxID=103762 RepID=A0A8J5SU65_ZIZPA|nr:hypothetical protein GUJ93_ZPchr0003g18051 [Zizania palustris]